ncbi:unnamed protein product [Spirodela intermedia]|uniref:VQ domain-containing protein n=1 Tax=Spirodela intermedia TaxID=51605 RepID=A0A7I8KKJ7_SPIIN|nr:unnamed protein product [Spirodela intermedia]
MGEECGHLEPWLFRPALGEGCRFAEAFTRETETLTRALQMSFYGETGGGALLPPADSSSHGGGFASVAVAAAEILRRPAGKISKRKPRPSRRSTTTFLTADPVNFREVVQQVTGAHQSGGRRPVARLAAPPEGLPPTLDTSALWLEASSAASPSVSWGSLGSGLGAAVDSPLSLPFAEADSWWFDPNPVSDLSPRF